MSEKVTRRIKVNDHIELSTFYKMNSSHDVICIDFKTQDEGGLGHISFHAQIDRLTAARLISALDDSLSGKIDKEEE